MEPEGSLPCSQEPGTGPYPEPDATIHTFALYFLKIHSNIIFPLMPSSSEWSLLSALPIKPFPSTKAVCKVRGLTLLLQVGTLWRCGDGLFFEVPPLASDALLTTLHPLLKNVLHTADHFEIWSSFSWMEKPRNCMEQDMK
jgi:hypothetical protein